MFARMKLCSSLMKKLVWLVDEEGVNITIDENFRKSNEKMK